MFRKRDIDLVKHDTTFEVMHMILKQGILTGSHAFGVAEQDADYDIREKSYSKLYINGMEFDDFKSSITIGWAVSAINTDINEEGVQTKGEFHLIWGMVEDNITGLVWEVKTNDRGKGNHER